MFFSILKKYDNLTKPVKASIWFVVSSFLLKGISFITLPIFTRLLTTSEYGMIAVYQSWLVIFSIVTTLSVYLGGVLNISITKFLERKNEVISSYQGLAITITSLFFLVSLIFIKPLSHILCMPPILITCMYIDVLVQIPFNIWATSQRYDYEYKNLVILTVINSILNPTVSIIAVLNFPSHKVEVKIIGSLIVSAIIGISLFIQNQKNGKKFFEWEMWKFGVCFSIVLIPHYLSTQILNQSDRVMINWIMGSSDAGIYSIAYNFAMIFILILSGVEASLTPYIYKSLKENKISQLYNNTVGIIGIEALLAIIFICFLPDIFMFLLPKAYYPALHVIPPVLIGIFFSMLYNIFGAVEFFYEENKYIAIASFIGATLNIILNYIFIPIFGFMAAAYTTLICYLAFCCVHYYFMKQVLKKNNKSNLKIYNTKAILLISIALILVNFIMIVVYNSFIIRWCIILFICIIMILYRNQIISIIKGLKE